VAALGKEMTTLCMGIIAHPDEDEPSTHLKEDLLQQHTLLKFQRNERLYPIAVLGSQRSTQLLAEMMELCPDGEENNCFYLPFPAASSPLAPHTAGGGRP
jgi:hypothetical protein